MTGRYKAYPEYKESNHIWLGSVPAHWDILRAKRIFTAVRVPVKESDEQLAASQKYGVVPQSLMMKLNNAKVMLALKGTDSFRHVDKDNFVISLRSFEGGIEHSAYEGCVSPAYTVLKASLKQCPVFFKYLLKCEPFIAALQSTTDSLRDGKSISYEQFGSIYLPYCNFEEQQKMANFLDHETAKIDTLITKQEKLIELLKEKRQAVISHAVTKGLNPDAPMKDSGVEWLGEVPEHWEVGRVKNLAKLISKGTTPSTIGGGFIDEGIRFLKGENIGKSLFVNLSPTFYISEEVDAQLSRSRLQENDVLVIIAGATTGKASILTKELLPANTNQAVSFIRPKKTIYSKLIALWLSTEYAQRIIWMGAVQAAQPNLSMEDLGNLPIVLPDEDEVIPLLNEIDRKIEQFDALTLKANSAIELMKERKTALISAAVTGKIDVRHFVLKQGQQQGVQG
ncbi:restriction endonuclease subunit S [Vibrio atlanticus]|uniref:restriction endonuclease subunit S n=1 Tax=Vibrio sp. 10N.261.46.A3 TaxID=3229658 RepID=UPI001C9D4B7E|nr:restriction endonuclease subunit S [Vibrio atlanticus]